MENYTLSELINAVKGEFLIGDPHAQIKNISIDTRTIKKDDFFVALTGNNFDGHNFIKQAIEKKASGLIVSSNDLDLGNPFPLLPAVIKVKDTTLALGDIARSYRKKINIPLIAVTGSNGKTTTKEMIAGILKQSGETLSTTGNFNNQIGLPLTIFNLNFQHKYAVIEMGTSYPGEIERLADIAAPTMGIITNIGFSHLEKLINREGVLAEKRKLIDALPEDGSAVINLDDPYLSSILPSINKKVITYGFNPQADVYAADVRLWPDKPSLKLFIDKSPIDIMLPVYGKFNVYNALAAAAAVWNLGISREMIKYGLENFTPPKMRMQIQELISGTVLINDAYNSNPSSVRASIESLVQTFPDRNKAVVLGDMLELGAESGPEHERLGEFLSSQPLGQILLYGPMMEKAMPALRNLSAKHFINKEELIEELKALIPTGMIIFFKGSRGMSLEKIIEKLITEQNKGN